MQIQEVLFSPKLGWMAHRSVSHMRSLWCGRAGRMARSRLASGQYSSFIMVSGRRAMSETVLSKQNTLLEGLVKKDRQSGAHKSKRIDSQITDRIKSSEAAYFFSEDNYLAAKMAGKDVHRGAMLEVHKPDADTEVKASYNELIEEEFAEFNRTDMPEALKIKVEEVKKKIYNVLLRTTVESGDKDDPFEKQFDIKDQIKAIDRKLIRSMMKMELGEREEREQDEHESKESYATVTFKDVAVTGVLLVLLGGGYLTFKVSTDEAHRREARRIFPVFVDAVEFLGL